MIKSVIKSSDLIEDLSNILSQMKFDKLFVLTDSNTYNFCLSYLKRVEERFDFQIFTIPAGDNNKNIDSLAQIWTFLVKGGATRHSLLINLGGGMITDIGGFAAATFKRGIRCINIPTTVLGAVDAAVGGKTGINFEGLKNEIGNFSTPCTVLIDSIFFKSLDLENILSGYAEMIKHALLDNETEWRKIISFDMHSINYQTLKDLTVTSVEVKERIVSEDPFEKGIRKALNLGHTIGHALESLSYTIHKPISHGYAVAWGTIAELYLSHKHCGFPIDKLRITANYIKEYYEGFLFDCTHYEALYVLMKHDKKNKGDLINFTFLKDIGQIKIDQTASKEQILESLDFLRDCVGL